MGFEYALVHLKYNIPIAIGLTYLYRPFFNRLDLARLTFLITIAVTATIPWDSYLIRQKIWTYPPNVIVGPTLFDIPAEELFFFVIQTYNTTFLYFLLSKPNFNSIFLSGRADKVLARNVGGAVWLGFAALGAGLVYRGGVGTYMGLILSWSAPFAFLLWTLAYQLLTELPWTSTALPIAAPTLYLWFVDTLALRRGTWSIESGTKFDVQLWDGLEIEEAVFFLATNLMIVFGLVAFDNALAVMETFPALFPNIPKSPLGLVRSLLISPSEYDKTRIAGLQTSVNILQKKSRSFFMASAMFRGRLRVDLIILYAFCRVADDLADDAATIPEAEKWIAKLTTFLDLTYKSPKKTNFERKQAVSAYVEKNFPPKIRAPLNLLPVERLSPGPLYELLEGFKMDLEFVKNEKTPENFPIKTEKDLDLYAYRVAGTVAEMVLELIFSHSALNISPAQRKQLVSSGGQMGRALQYTNIGRDMAVDATINRVYIPSTWLKEQGLVVDDLLRTSAATEEILAKFRARVIDMAFEIYEANRANMELLPSEGRGPIRVAIESYMEIGRVLQEKGPNYRNIAGKATVPPMRRITTAWNAMAKGRQGPVLMSRHFANTNGTLVQQKRKSAIVVGAGAGGVAVAARLGKAGFDVTVYEKNGFNGGRCSLIHRKGYRFDQGPSLLLLPKMFHEAFHDLGTTLPKEDVHLVKCEPNYNLWFDDGSNFKLSTDQAFMKKEIEKWEGKGGFERYLSYLAESHRHYELSVTHVLKKTFESWFSMARPSFLVNALRLHPFESIYSRASRYFHTERLRRVFTFGSMYMGMSPFNSPATYSLLQYTELAEGIWYPIGGFNKVVQALEGIAKRFGVKFKYNAGVSKILLSENQKIAQGVILESGEQVRADVVVCNADLVYAYNELLPPSSAAKDYSKRDGSCSSISFYWSMNSKIPELSAHNIFLAEEYQESFDAIFDRKSIPSEPSFYVNVPSRLDPSAAPEGCDSLIVLVPVGHRPGPGEKRVEKDWAAEVEKIRDLICKIVESRTRCQSLKDAIIDEEVNTPPIWQQKFNLDKGAILGLSHSFFNVLSFRPRIKHPKISNMFFVGASTHPGTGVPIVLAGSRLTSDQILKEQNMDVPGPTPNAMDDQGVQQDQYCLPLDKDQSNHKMLYLLLLTLITVFMGLPILSSGLLSLGLKGVVMEPLGFPSLLYNTTGHYLNESGFFDVLG